MYGLTDDGSFPNIALLTASLEGHEGNILYVYDDANGNPIVKGYTVIGNPTIGTGRLLTRGNGISNAERQLLLSNDIATAIEESQGEPWWSHVVSNEPRTRAMVEICFELGLPTLRNFVVAIAALCRDDFGAAADAFMQSRWAQQVGQRAVDLTQMIRGWDDKTKD